MFGLKLSRSAAVHTRRFLATRVGFVGLGNMGGPMAANLLKAKHQVTVCDVNATAGAIRAPPCSPTHCTSGFKASFRSDFR